MHTYEYKLRYENRVAMHLMWIEHISNARFPLSPTPHRSIRSYSVPFIVNTFSHGSVLLCHLVHNHRRHLYRVHFIVLLYNDVTYSSGSRTTRNDTIHLHEKTLRFGPTVTASATTITPLLPSSSSISLRRLIHLIVFWSWHKHQLQPGHWIYIKMQGNYFLSRNLNYYLQLKYLQISCFSCTTSSSTITPTITTATTTIPNVPWWARRNVMVMAV